MKVLYRAPSPVANRSRGEPVSTPAARSRGFPALPTRVVREVVEKSRAQSVLLPAAPRAVLEGLDSRREPHPLVGTLRVDLPRAISFEKLLPEAIERIARWGRGAGRTPAESLVEHISAVTGLNRRAPIVTAALRGGWIKPAPSRCSWEQLLQEEKSVVVAAASGLALHEAAAAMDVDVATAVKCYEQTLLHAGARNRAHLCGMFGDRAPELTSAYLLHRRAFYLLDPETRRALLQSAAGKTPVQSASDRGQSEAWLAEARRVAAGMETLGVNTPAQLALRLAALDIVRWPVADPRISARLRTLHGIDFHLLGLLGCGYEPQEMGALLGLSAHGARERLAAILRHLGVDNEPTGALLAVRLRLAPRPELVVQPRRGDQPPKAIEVPFVPDTTDPRVLWWRFTPTERSIVAMVCGGLTNADIAGALGWNLQTVERRIERLCHRAACVHRSKLAAFGARMGIETALIGRNNGVRLPELTPRQERTAELLREGQMPVEMAPLFGIQSRPMAHFVERLAEKVGVPTKRGFYGMAHLAAVMVNLGPAALSDRRLVPFGLSDLGAQEEAVARGIALGKPVPQIARETKSSHTAVVKTRENILRKMDLDDELQLFRALRARGEVPDYEPSENTVRALRSIEPGTEEAWLLDALGVGMSIEDMGRLQAVPSVMVLRKLTALRERLGLATNVELVRAADYRADRA